MGISHFLHLYYRLTGPPSPIMRNILVAYLGTSYVLASTLLSQQSSLNAGIRSCHNFRLCPINVERNNMGNSLLPKLQHLWHDVMHTSEVNDICSMLEHSILRVGKHLPVHHQLMMNTTQYMYPLELELSLSIPDFTQITKMESGSNQNMLNS